MNESTKRQQAIEKYIQECIERTNDGRVFTIDTSTLDTSKSIVLQKMTCEEKLEREEWEKTRSDLLTLYRQKHIAFYRVVDDLSPAEMLMLRVSPPFLNDRVIDSRARCTDDRHCLYLDHAVRRLGRL